MKKTELLKLNTIGERLKYLRNGKNQQIYADIMGISVPSYCKYEKNAVEADWRKLKAIAEHNKITLNDLTKGL